MINNSQKQTGSAHIAIVVILVIVLLSTIGFIFYQNFIKKDSSSQTPANSQSAQDDSNRVTETPAATLKDAVAGINEVILAKGCASFGTATPIASNTFKEVSDSEQFVYNGGISRINIKFTYAYVQYGCGSQGEGGFLKKMDGKWMLVSESARIYPLCNSVRDQGFPASIIDKCYIDDKAADPVKI